MKKRLFAPVVLALAVLLAACQIDDPTPTPLPVDLTETPAPLPATQTPEPQVTQPPPGAELPDEAILILSPGPGSRVTNPVRVRGEADPTFEQNLGIRVLLEDGTELAETFATIQADMGQRGAFEAEFNLALEEERNIFILVFATSARDGGVTHLSSTIAMFSPTGPEAIVARTPEPERITIFAPQHNDTISGVQMVVEGYGLASFEQTLVVEVYDEDGNRIAQSPVMVDAPDLGLPGPFRAEIAYELDTPGPGRVVVRDISPAHGEDVHLTSVEVQLAP